MSNILSSRYEIIKGLSAGGFGRTFLAKDLQMPSKRKCIIKQFNPSGSNARIDNNTRALLQERFSREAAVLEQLSVSNSQIPKLYAYFVEGNEFYLVQEFIEGQTLEELVCESMRSIKEPESFAHIWQEDVKKFLHDMLPVLNYIHSHEVIHRDIKPANIIIRSSDYKPVLIDFGAVKELTTSLFGHPSTSIMIGTPYYMPSEQVAGKPLYSSDLYALGLTSIFFLTGRKPQTLFDHETGIFRWEHYAEDVDSHLIAILNKSIRPFPHDRYRCAPEMLTALQNSIKEHCVQRWQKYSYYGLQVLGIHFTELDAPGLHTNTHQNNYLRETWASESSFITIESYAGAEDGWLFPNPLLTLIPESTKRLFPNLTGQQLKRREHLEPLYVRKIDRQRWRIELPILYPDITEVFTPEREKELIELVDQVIDMLSQEAVVNPLLLKALVAMLNGESAAEINAAEWVNATEADKQVNLLLQMLKRYGTASIAVLKGDNHFSDKRALLGLAEELLDGALPWSLPTITSPAAPLLNRGGDVNSPAEGKVGMKQPTAARGQEAGAGKVRTHGSGRAENPDNIISTGSDRLLRQDVEDVDDLFPLYGVILGKTTITELSSLGINNTYVDEKAGLNIEYFLVNDIKFFAKNGVASSFALGYYDSFPQNWKSLGLDPEGSYNQWLNILQRLGYNIRESKAQGSTFAQFMAKGNQSPPVYMDLLFSLKKNETKDTPKTLLSISCGLIG